MIENKKITWILNEMLADAEGKMDKNQEWVRACN